MTGSQISQAIFAAALQIASDQKHASVSQIGLAERSGYTAIGTVCNVAARL
jgi:hypothetical protein